MNNIFNNIPANIPEEIFEIIIIKKNIRIERIISNGHSSPEGFWYEQSENEWVIILKGEAKLRLFDGEVIHLQVGDYFNIPAMLKHRVEWTTEEKETIWLAVFY